MRKTRATTANAIRIGVLQVLLPLSVGVLIYILFRDPRLLVFEWLGSTGTLDWLLKARQVCEPLRPPAFVVYSLPGALWLYAFAAFMSVLWYEVDALRPRLPWIALPFLVAAASEGAQLLGYTDGTFDWKDVGGYAVALVVSVPTLIPARLSGEPASQLDVRRRHWFSCLSAVCFSLIIRGADVVSG